MRRLGAAFTCRGATVLAVAVHLELGVPCWLLAVDPSPYRSPVMSEKHLMGAVRYVERNPVKAELVERAEDWPWSSAAAHCAACDGGEVGDMTQMRSGAKHSGSCTQTGPAECDWLVDRAAGMTSTWSEHLAWRDDTELSQLMRRLENTGRPLGDTDFVKQIGQLLSRDLLPKKRGPKGPWKKKQKKGSK